MNADQDSTDNSEKQETGNWGIPGLAFDFYFKNFTQLFLLVLQVFFLWYLADYLLEAILQSDLILRLIYGVLLVPLSVAVHRAIILQEPLDASQYLPSFRHGRVWKFFGYGVLFSLIAFLIFWAFALIAGTGLFAGALSMDRGGGVGVALVFGFAILLVSAIGFSLLLRFTFVWPAIATDQFRSLGDCGRQMRGMIWKVLGALIVVGLPLIVLGVLAQVINLQAPFSYMASLASLVSYVASMLWLPMGTAVLSFAYVSATDE